MIDWASHGPAALGAFAAGLMAAGLLGGLLAGLLGVGGGIVVVPVLFHVLSALGLDESIRMPVAVGTSLATIIPTTLRAVSGHRAKGAVDDAILRQWAPAMIVGVVLASLSAEVIGGRGLTLIFAVMALLVALNLGFGRESWRLGAALPGGPGRAALAGGIGYVSTLMGIGGGTFGVTAMTLYGVPIHRAVGTAAGLGLIISIPGTAGFLLAGLDAQGLPPFSLGYVNLLGFALIVPSTILATPWGVELAHRLSRTALRRAFAVFLALTSARMFWEVLT